MLSWMFFRVLYIALEQFGYFLCTKQQSSLPSDELYLLRRVFTSRSFALNFPG